MTTGVGGVGGTAGGDAPEGMFLDLADPAFDTTSEQVHEAREADWLARTPYGFAVLRYEEANALLTDRRFRQGNARWPEQNGVTGGPFLDWWQRVLLSLDGDDHARLRRLLMPAFKRQAIVAMQPRFVEIAEDLIAGFALDAEDWRPETEDDLYRYCYHVAGVVGCMMAVTMGVAPEVPPKPV